jgi:3'-phosphoadenosine 5'-phosphosulfate sulfotransferase (PAPS reductase)/FAD synthetase
MKEKLLISFSGGETSAYMSQWLWKEMQHKYEMLFVFANTGQENEETLEFTHKCSKHFGFPLVWVEADVNKEEGKGTTHRVVDFKTASRSGRPFEDVIKKYGIPNQNAPFCTRELKEKPIKSFAKSIGWKDYFLAIGIREDEIDRMSPNRKKNKIIYPLISFRPMTKPKINFWWTQQPFRLNLKGYQGNCKTCWKKGIYKLYQIAKEAPEHYDFFKRMEDKYGSHITEAVRKNRIERGLDVNMENKFFRGNKSVEDILKEATEWDGVVKDDSSVYDSSGIQMSIDLDGDSCEVFSTCRT